MKKLLKVAAGISLIGFIVYWLKTFRDQNRPGIR